MNSLRTLHDAFQELEHRADTAPDPAPESPLTKTAHGHRAMHVLAPVAAAAAVVAVVASAVAVAGHDSRSAPGARPATAAASVDGSPTATGPAASAPTSPTGSATPTSQIQLPTTGAKLTAKVNAILAGLATIDVAGSGPGAIMITAPAAPGASAPASVSTSPDTTSGASIYGTLTAAGCTGGFDLDVFLNSPGITAMCDGDAGCSVRHLADGSTLAAGTWTDPNVPGGITYQVEVVRPDGVDILMHLSTEHSPKGASTVTASSVPLTINQMIDFVTSDRW